MPGHLLNRERVDVEECFNGDNELPVPWARDAEVLGHHLPLRFRVPEDRQALHNVGEAQGKVLDRLPIAERDLLVIRSQVLRRRLPYALVADAHRPDGLPCLLGRRLGRQSGYHLLGHTGADSFERGAIVVEVHVVFLDGLPYVACLQVQLHQQRPRIVIRLGQLWPISRATRLPNDALDDDLAWAPRW